MNYTIRPDEGPPTWFLVMMVSMLALLLTVNVLSWVLL